MANDPELGKTIHAVLHAMNLETPMHVFDYTDAKDNTTTRKEKTRAQISNLFANIMGELKLDLNDDSLHDTPARVAKMFCEEIFSGLDYNNFPSCTVIENAMGYDEIVCVRDIVLRSTCEHHFQPIYGKCHIAYIPAKKVLGLSKFSRIASFFASRPQVQERLTEQIAATLQYVLDTSDVAVMIEAEHFCMKMRGVQDACSITSTSKMNGRFRTDEAARLEVINLMRG